MTRRRYTRPGPDALVTCEIECRKCGRVEKKYMTVRRVLAAIFEKCPVCRGEQSVTKVDE